MVQTLFVILAVAIAYALSMRRAGLWTYALLALATWWIWASGTLDGDGVSPEITIGTVLLALPVLALIAFAIPSVRRSVLVSPASKPSRRPNAWAPGCVN